MKGMTRSRRKNYKLIEDNFETLKTNEEESIATYFLCVDDIVNTIRILGEEVKETIIGKKVFMSLHSIFDPKIYAIEKISDLDNLRMDVLHEILSTYEMRIEKDNPIKQSRKKETFKA
jgi:hypothetical protein